MANQNKLKAYVRYDGTGRVIAGGPILQRFKPKVGNWVEIDAKECCNDITTTTTTTSTSTSTTTTTTTTSQPPSSFTGYGASNVNDACAQSGGNPGLTLYSFPGISSPVYGLPVFSDSGLTTPYANQSGNWFGFGGRAYRIDGGSIVQDENCI